MGLASMEEAFNFEVLGIKAGHNFMVVAYLPQTEDHIKEQLEVHRQVVQHLNVLLHLQLEDLEKD